MCIRGDIDCRIDKNENIKRLLFGGKKAGETEQAGYLADAQGRRYITALFCFTMLHDIGIK